MLFQFEIEDSLVAQGATQGHAVMEDRAEYTVEMVRQALIATFPRLVTDLLLYPDGITQDYKEFRPAEFNDTLEALKLHSVKASSLEASIK